MNGTDLWEQAKSAVGKMIFPDLNSSNWIEISNSGAYHQFGTNDHDLKCYVMNLSPVFNFPLQALYKKCPECLEDRIKDFLLFDHKENKVFVYEIYHKKWYEGRKDKKKINFE